MKSYLNHQMSLIGLLTAGSLCFAASIAIHRSAHNPSPTAAPAYLLQESIHPSCLAPTDVTVSCENFDPSLWVYGQPVVDSLCFDTTITTVDLSAFDTVCNKGTITRAFTVVDCNGQQTECSQRIVVTPAQHYYVRFPDDVIITSCDTVGFYGEPTIFGDDCGLMLVSYEDQYYSVVPDGCARIIRTWKVINWCNYDPLMPCINVPNPHPEPISIAPANLPGPVVSPLGTPDPWAPTVVKVYYGDTMATNYASYWSADANCYQYTQAIRFISSDEPVIDNCPGDSIAVKDSTANDPLLYHSNSYWDPIVQTNDLCETPVELTITASDVCKGSILNIRYLLFLDMDNNGTMESVINSNNLPGFNNINTGNADNPNFTGGTPQPFDFRPVPANQKYGFALQNTLSGGKRTARVAWNTLQAQTTFTTPQLPHGRHKIKWFVSDYCGNETVCEYLIEVKDGQPPTVVCQSDLLVSFFNFVPIVKLWDTDFLHFTTDNSTTPESKITTGIRLAGAGTGFPRDSLGNPVKYLTFKCFDPTWQQVEVWAEDLAGNADFCLTNLFLQDPHGFCEPPNASNIMGTLKTEAGKGVQGVNVGLLVQLPNVPPFNFFAVTPNDGSYQLLQAVPLFADAIVTPTKNQDPLNGASTYDLVLISKHILGKDTLNTPYKLIAADINRSGSITTFDVVEARKLILGLYNNLPNNKSWRFVDKTFLFPNPNNPFQTIFPESITIVQANAYNYEANFIAVKVGDVNGSAIPGNVTSTTDRSVGTLWFDAEDRKVKAGDVFTVHFNPSEDVQGYQFTLNLKDLDVVEVLPGNNMTASNFAIFADAVTASVDGADGPFGITFRAKREGQLSQMLGASSRITRAEAYNGGGERMEVAFRFNGNTIADSGFELYQNQPNPFVDKTTIGFHLPEATEATLTIFDQSGRTVYQQTAAYAPGYNAVRIDHTLLNTKGLLYYRLETAEDSATKIMVLLE